MINGYAVNGAAVNGDDADSSGDLDPPGYFEAGQMLTAGFDTGQTYTAGFDAGEVN